MHHKRITQNIFNQAALTYAGIFFFFSFFSFCVFCSGLISAFPMFGSCFFYIQSCSSSTIQAPCILAVNLNGLHFLNKDTHVCHSHKHITDSAIHPVSSVVHSAHEHIALFLCRNDVLQNVLLQSEKWLPLLVLFILLFTSYNVNKIENEKIL